MSNESVKHESTEWPSDYYIVFMTQLIRWRVNVSAVTVTPDASQCCIAELNPAVTQIHSTELLFINRINKKNYKQTILTDISRSTQ